MSHLSRPLRVLITAGPTHEPIDSVRYLANRSSGTLGIALATQSHSLGFNTRLLLGPIPGSAPSGVQTHRFITASDLQALLQGHAPWADLIVMAAAVADFRPRASQEDLATKIRRSNAGHTIEMEPTPDLLAQIAEDRRPGQTLVGFALEPVERLFESAAQKLTRKGIDFIVANPLETMDSDQIEATLLARDPEIPPRQTQGMISKDAFADWLLDILAPTALAAAVH